MCYSPLMKTIVSPLRYYEKEREQSAKKKDNSGIYSKKITTKNLYRSKATFIFTCSIFVSILVFVAFIRKIEYLKHSQLK